MKDTKTILLLVVSILLIFVSVVLMYTWTYRINSVVATSGKKGSSLQAGKLNSSSVIEDSLRYLYNNVLGNINRSIDSARFSTDSLKGNLGVKMREFYTLRSEISDLLKTKLSDEDIVKAKEKIVELQQRIAELRLTNTEIEDENRRLNNLVAQLSRLQNSNAVNTSYTSPVASMAATSRSQENTEVHPTDVRLNAFMETGNDLEQETMLAQQTSKLIASFSVKNNSNEANMIELVVIVVQPDGKVLQRSTWETGSFDTKDGKKIYTYKTRADFDAWETKRMNFSLSNDKYQKGNYSMQIYNKGVLVARISKSLG